MRAVVFDRFGETPRIADVPAPALSPRGAIVRVAATGVCRSDWHAWMGHDPDVTPPHVPGHEFAGIVDQVGAEVTRVAPGDRVTAPFVYACGRCRPCREGDGQVCAAQQQPGFTLPGSFADLVEVVEADLNLVPLPDAIGFAEAAGLGCRFATAYRAVVTRGAVAPGQWVAVHGCGGVGLSAIHIAHALGARVIGVDVSAAALEAATALGAVAVQSGSDAVARIRELTDGGAHLSLDAFGSADTSAASIRSLRPRGRHVQVGLMLGAAATAPMPMAEIIAHELDVLGSHGMPAHEYPEMLARIADGTLSPADMVGRRIGFDELPAALEAIGQPGQAAGMTVAVL